MIIKIDFDKNKNKKDIESINYKEQTLKNKTSKIFKQIQFHFKFTENIEDKLKITSKVRKILSKEFYKFLKF